MEERCDQTARQRRKPVVDPAARFARLQPAPEPQAQGLGQAAAVQGAEAQGEILCP